MSLVVSGSAASNIAPIPEGTHLGVCFMLVDIGMQYNETFKNSSRKVVIGWEIPGETIELEDGVHNRTISKIYTSSLNESANLRQDLAAWRGRDFTPEELEAFNLRNIIGTSCLINVVHKEKSNGSKVANIQSIMALPKGMEKGQLSEATVIFDLDTDPLQKVESLPEWISKMIKKSETYEARFSNKPAMTEVEDDGELPF